MSLSEDTLARIDYGAHKPAKKRSWSALANYCWCCMMHWPCPPALEMQLDTLAEALDNKKQEVVPCPYC